MRSKKLFYRIMSMLLACLMALGGTGLVTTASAASSQTSKEAKLAIIDDLYFQHTPYAGVGPVYEVTVSLSVVNSAGVVGATSAPVTFTVKIPDGSNSKSVEITGNGNVHAEDDPGPTEQRVVLKGCFDESTIMSLLDSSVGINKSQIVNALNDTNMTDTKFKSDYGKYFQKNIRVTLKSVGPDNSGVSWIGENWVSDSMTLTSRANLFNVYTFSEKKVTSAQVTDLTNLNIAHDMAMNMGGSNCLVLKEAFSKAATSQYVLDPNPQLGGGNQAVFVSAGRMVHFRTQSFIFGDANAVNPPNDAQFKPDSTVFSTDSTDPKYFDGWLPYRATIKGLKAAYAKVYGEATALSLLTSTTLEAATAFSQACNASKTTTEGKYFTVDSYPGLFYQYVNNGGAYSSVDTDVEELVRDITASYDMANDTLIINYKLRSTNNSVYFDYIPVQLNGNTVTSKVIEQVTGRLDQANIQHGVTCSVSIMDFPDNLGSILGKDGGVFYSAGYRGDADNNNSNDKAWYGTKAQEWYFVNDAAGVATGCGDASTNNADQQIYFNITAPKQSQEGVDGAYYTPGGTGEAAFNTIHTENNSDPKITWTGTMMWTTNGAPGASVSLSSTQWGNGEPVDEYPVVRIEKNVLQGTGADWYEGEDGLSYFEVVYQTDARPTSIKLNETEIPAGTTKWAPDNNTGGIVFSSEATTDPRPIEGNMCADDKFVISLMPGDKIELMFISDDEIVCSIKEIVRGGHERAVSVTANNMYESDLSTTYSGQIIKDPTEDPTTEAYFKAGKSVGENARIVYLNALDAIEGEAHVIIDYNMNGKVATVADTMAEITSSQLVDCGAHQVGETIDVKPVFGLEDLVVGQTYDVPAGSGTLNCKYLGVYTDAEGGTEITDGKYTITRPGLTVLYAHWEFSMDSIPIPTPSTSSTLHQVIFHDNYDGGGMTTTVWGTIQIDLACGSATISFGEPDAIQNTRPGWYLYGWYGGPTPGSADASNLTVYKYEQDGYDWAAHSVELRDAIRDWFERNDWPDRFNIYAIWTPNPTYFDANGGYFESGDDLYYNVSTAKDGQGRCTRYGGFVKSDGKTPYHGFFPSSLYKLPKIEQVPVREGYEFTGWYCDKDCSIPMTVDANGIMPGVTYYAGWQAQKVTVNYYDTREGMGHINSQEYNYDDLLTLISEPDAANSPSQPDTAGQHFTNWGDKDGDNVTTTGTALNVATLGDRLVKHVSTVTNANGVQSELVYWTLDLYTQWSEKTATYFANVVFNDLENNDGCRPTEVVLGVVSSVTNKEAGEITIPVSPTGRSASGQLDNLPITNVDASVEKVTYRMYLKSYKDINNDVHIIQDTTAQSGSFEVPTTSLGSTTPLTSYSYALNNVNHGDTYAAYNGTLYLNHSLITTESDIRFTLTWADASNRDGQRPSSVKLVLLANGSPNLDDVAQNKEYISVVSVNPGMCEVSADGNSWTYTFKGFQKYTNTTQPGTAIDYTVVVLDDNVDYQHFSTPYSTNGYTARYLTGSQSAGDHAGVVLHRPLDRVDKTVRITWSDEFNRDGFRAESVTVDLYAYGYNRLTESWEKWFVDSAVVTGGMTSATWSYTFRDLYQRSGGEDIVYMAEVSSDLNAHVPEGVNEYSWTASELEIIISQEHTVGDVVATVQWADRNNNDSYRPGSVILELYADGKPLTEYGWSAEDWRVVLSGDMTADSWTYVYHDIPEYAPGDAGHKLVYSLKVVEASGGDLYGDCTEHGALGEEHTFVRYTESYPNDRGEFVDDFNASRQPVSRLTHEINQIEVPVNVTWRDEGNRDGQRSDYVTLALTAYQWNRDTYRWEYVETATQTVRADAANTMTADEWTATFGLHDMYHDGVKVIYHLAVVSDLNEFLPVGSFEYGWTETAHGNQVDAIPQVTISQNVNTTSAQGVVYWDDSENNDNIRPSNIVLQLYVHTPGEKPVPVKGQAYRVNVTGDPTADNWDHTFSGMPKYAAGQSGVELIYTVRAVEADGEPLYGYYVITANGEEEEVLRYEASYLHEGADGTENTLDADLSDRAYVKLSHVTETKTMNFSVNWHDGDNRDNVRLSSVPAALYKTVGDSAPVYLRAMNITAGKNGTWTQKVTDLPGYEGGQSVKYNVQVPEDAQRELAAAGYTVTVQDNIIHLYYTPKTGEIGMKLYWSDDDDNDGYRPDSVAAELYANGAATGKTIDLNRTNDWSATWTDLDVHYVDGTTTGTDVVYSVVVETPSGYTVAYEPESTTIEANELLYVRLTHEGDTADVPVTIYWNDASDNDHKRPETLTVQLLADGQEVVGRTLTLDASDASESADAWTGAFEDMPVYGGDGEKIYYSLKVYDPTTTTGGYDLMTAGTTLYLSYKPVKSAMYVSIQFDDGFNADGVRPTGLYLRLTANGVPVDDSEYKHTVSFDTNVDGYVWIFGELPVYAADGRKIAYNVEVSFAPELGATDYSVWTSADIKLSESAAAAANQVIVKLSRSVETTVLDGKIYWFDCNNMVGQRPSSLYLVMRDDADGSSIQYEVNAGTGEVVDRGTRQVVGSVSVAEWTGDSSVWNYTITGVPERYAHKLGASSRIYYYVTANTTSIARYYPTVLTGEDYGMDVALTHKDYETYAAKASQDYTVDIMWLDNSDAWGLRPDSGGVKVDLLANGETYDTVVLTKDDAKDGNPNAWTHMFENIPTYRNGGAIVWSVALPDVDKYIREQTVSTAAASTYRFTQAIGFDLTAIWDDSSDDDAVRPESITVGVYGDGTLAGTVTLTGEGNTWTGSISPLPVWRESDADAAIQYTFLWTEATEQYLSEKGYTASPTMDGQPAQSGRFYWLSTEEFGDYEAEGFDSLAGTYDWETTLRYQQEQADYHFTVTFDDEADRDGIRPDTVKVELLADGEVIDTREITVNAGESMYDLAWEQLDVNEAGKAIAYTIRLVDKLKGYTVSYNAMNTAVTLTHEPERVCVTGTVNWDDSTQLVDVYNANGTYVRSYEQIARAGVNVRLLADGESCGEPVYIGKATYGEGEKLEPSAGTEWPDLYKYRDHGTEIVYTMEVGSDELTALLDDGHSLTYDFGTKYAPRATVTHDLYDIRGTVYYMYSYSDDFLLNGVPVTAYLRVADGNYKAVGSAVTGEDGTFEILNLPQGLYIIRATYQYGQNTLAGTKGMELNRKDGSATVIIDREAVNDSGSYRYTASGAAYYQTDATDAGTIKPVPEGSVVLLYRLDDGQTEPVYVGMTTIDGSGRYRFEGLTAADYVVNVVFNYDGGTYTYDNADALAGGMSFNVLGADVTWPDIVKQVNGKTDIKDPEKPDEPVVTPPEEPVPCVVGGSVFYADSGVHTTDPVEGVDVHIYLTPNAEVGNTSTDENGRWSMEGLSPADYIAVFSYQGSASRVLLFTVTEEDYEAGTYEAATQYFDRTVETPAGTIKGVVLDEQGKSMRALVGIYNTGGTLLDFAYTDTYGNYEFTVAAGYDYNVRILAVEDEVERLNAGDPDDELTTLDYYVLSGVFAVDGKAQAGQLVAVYYEQDGEYSLVTATLTDESGRFSVKVNDEGNYKVCPYINEKIYETRYVSVGYQEERLSVSVAVNGSYTISGIEHYDALVLYKITDGVEATVQEKAEAGGSYEIKNLDAGEYRLKLTKGGRETWYYITCPEGTLVDVTYRVTVSGSVLDDDGSAVVGARAEIFDTEDNPAGEPVTILSDGGYSWHELPEGKYTVVVTKPNTSSVIADKWTHEPDSYGIAYADGMTGGGTWTWNVNAHMVSGNVTDQKGKPISGAYVTFEHNGTRFVAITGEDGTYSIGLAPGEYSAGAVYHWDADHAYHATGTIHLKVSGDEADVDFNISRHELTIEAVRMADGDPASGAELAVRFEDGTLFWAGKADEDGKAAVTVFPGTYRVFGKYDGSKTASTDVTATGDKTIVLELDSVVYITGTVRDGEGNAVPDGLVYYNNGKGNAGRVYTDDEGRYVIPVASDALGDYEIYAAHGAVTGEAVTVSVYTDVELDLTASGNGEEPSKKHVISGVVSDENGERLPNALVTMVWGNDKANQATTSTNSLGEYAFAVEDGTYYLTAAYEADNGECYETNSQSAVHVNGTDEAVDLMVLIGYEVVVTVIDADGNAVAGATVYYEGAASGEAGTGSNGTVSLHLPKGNYQFWARTESRTSQTVSLTVAGRESLTLELENAGIFYEEPEVSENKLTIWGFVYAPDGKPVQGANVELYRQDLETLEWNLVDSTGTDADGRYEFGNLENGTYRVDTVYTYSAEAEVGKDG